MADNTTNSPHKTVANNAAMFIEETPSETTNQRRSGIGRRRFASKREDSPELPLDHPQQPTQTNIQSGDGYQVTFEQNENDNKPKDTYFHRRTMAYVSLFAVICMTIGLAFLPVATITALTVPYTVVVPALLSVTLAYIGASTISWLRSQQK